MIQVFRVYRQLKEANPSIKFPEVDRLLEIHGQGELAVHLAKIGKGSKDVPKK